MKRKKEMHALEVALALTLLAISFLILTAFFASVSPKQEQQKEPERYTDNMSDFEIPESGKNGNGSVAYEEGDFSEIEKDLFVLVNRERTERGLEPLEWDDGVAYVARRHSQDLAEENRPLTERNLSCPRSFIHHEGFESGLYHYDRLHNEGIYYFASSGENIFMIAGWKSLTSFVEELPAECPPEEEIVMPYENGTEQVQKDYEELLDYVATAQRLKWSDIEWYSREEIEKGIVNGWMESPGHRELILTPVFTDAGIGVAKVNDYYVVTQVFIERLECGYETGTCCYEPGFYPYCYDELHCINAMCYS